MKLVTFREKGKQEQMVGIMKEDAHGILPIKKCGLPYSSMQELIENINPTEWEQLKREAAKQEPPYQMEDIVLLAPIPKPAQDIICLGVNYRAHAKEAEEFMHMEFDQAAEKSDNSQAIYPVYFSKRVNAATAAGQEIPNYSGLVDGLDYEVELAAIIGKDAKNVPKGSGKDYIFGYTIMNDMSARNLQTRHTQWYFGKSLDGFTPMGPCIVTADEFSWPVRLKIESYVNGELRQSSNTDHMIFDLDYVISDLSRGMTLKAGTIIAMGTPEGVGMGFQPPRFLHPGDVITCEIEGIGTLENRVSARQDGENQ